MSDGGKSADERIAELEVELAAAQRTIDVLIARLERAGTTPPTQAELFDAAVRLGHVLEERTREVEAARAEFRALRANLDQIVRQRTRALAESEAQLRAKNIELDKQMRIKTEFITIAAHELRTPLTSIVGYLDLFSEGRFGELPADIERPMGSVRRNAHRLKRLVDDMLNVSRIESGSIVLRREPVDLGEVVRDVVTELLPLARARNQTVETNIEPVASLDADRDKLHQIAVNLLSNAIRYTPEAGAITIGVDEAPRERYAGGWARLRVRDNGVGISEEDRQRIFDPFMHPKPVKHHTSAWPDSAGLGLYIARGLIELHGGLITVDSQPDVFTEFTVLLPFKQPRQRPASSDPPSRPTPEPPARPTPEPSARLTSEPPARPTPEPPVRPTPEPSARQTSEPPARPTPEPPARLTPEPPARLTPEPTGRSAEPEGRATPEPRESPKPLDKR